MRTLNPVLLIFFALLSCWSLAAAITHILHLPAMISILLTLTALGAVCYYFRSELWHGLTAWRHRWQLAVVLVLISAACSWFTLKQASASLDDLNYLSYSIETSQDFLAPLPTQLDMFAGAQINIFPAYTYVNYEGLHTVFFAFFGLPPLTGYYGFVIIIILAMTFTYFALLLELRLAVPAAAIGTFLILAFLYYDASSPLVSFGSYAFPRLWQGKSIVINLGVPALMLFTLRLLRRPKLKNLVMLILVTIACVSLTTTGIYMSAVVVGLITLAYYLVTGFKRNRLRRFLVVSLSGVYVVLVTLILTFQGMDETATQLSDQNRWPTDWWENVQRSFGSAELWQIMLRNIGIPLLAPLLALGRTQGRMLSLYSAFILLLFFTPIFAPTMIKIIPPIVYWRVTYLLPVPLGIGLLVNTLYVRRRRSKQLKLSGAKIEIVGIAISTIILFMVFSGFGQSITSTFSKPMKGKEFKGALESPIADKYRELDQALKELLPTGGSLIAPPHEAAYLYIQNPRLSFVSVRPNDTWLYFDVDGMPEQIQRRLVLTNFVRKGPRSPKHVQALRKAIREYELSGLIVPQEIYETHQKRFDRLKALSVRTPVGDYTILSK